MHSRHGELLANGFHVGDLVTYEGTESVGYVTPTSEGRDHMVYATYDYSREAALRAYEGERRGTWMPTDSTRLIMNYQGITPQEGSNTMTTATETEEAVEFWFNGEPLRASMRVTELVGEQEYRIIYPRDHHDMELTARALRTERLGRSGHQFTVTGWPRPNDRGGWGPTTYPVGSTWSTGSQTRLDDYSYNFIIPVGVRGDATPAATDSNYKNEPGTFGPHNGHMPEPGTVVRGMMVTGPHRQIEGLFLRADAAAGVATIEAKRYRRGRGGSFGEWSNYQNTTRRNIKIDGAEVFTPGPGATPTFVRTTAIKDERDQEAIPVNGILSAPSASGPATVVYRGKVISVDRSGPARILATEEAHLADPYGTDVLYDWVSIDPQEVEVHCTWSNGRSGFAKAGWLWEELAPGQQLMDPAFDPSRATPYTGQKIGDLVVGLRTSGGRDTVSSWVRGVIVKWDLRNGNPYVKVTDPMESDYKVDQEVTVYSDDTYPALADPKNADPEEFKKTLRNYLIGRHKRSDFCRGGLNTMLAAFGLPLYETKRRAQMVMTVEYDPNTTDLYSVQRSLRTGIAGVQGLSMAERSGEDIELAIESDRTAG